MNQAIYSDIDMIEELRLRRWAREHYVAASQRSDSWHPIVLDEMRVRDQECKAQRQRLAHCESTAL